MLLRKIGFIFLCCFFLYGCSQEQPVFHDNKGNTIEVESLKGKWLIINYWAAWCPTCVYEIPELNRFYQNNKDETVLLLGVNYDELNKMDLDVAIEKAKIDFPVLVENPANQFQLENIDYLPVTFILNPKGEIAKKIVGSNTEESLRDVLNKLKKDYEK